MSKIIVKHASMVTGCGESVESNIEALTGKFSPARLRLKNFPAHNYLKDKRTVKVVNDGDRYGLTAVSLLESAMTGSGTAKSSDPYRTGLFTGISPASSFSNENYFEAMQQAGEGNVAAFGTTYIDAHPTTLLTGLPNNVLCYGAIILEAKGPNSNYTAMETSGHLALMAAGSLLKNGLIDIGIAGGVSAHKNKIFENMMRQNEYLAETEGAFPGSNGTAIADGAVFLMIEAAEDDAKGIELVAWTRTTGSANFFSEVETAKFPHAKAIQRCLSQAEISTVDVGCVFLSGTGIPSIDGMEATSVAALFGNSGVTVAATSRVTGNLMEAGGLFELPLFGTACEKGSLPAAITVSGGSIDGRSKPYALILRSSVYGDVSCLLIKWNG